MEAIDLATYGGVITGTAILIELLKTITIDFEIKSKPWYPALLNLATLSIAMGLSLVSYYFIVEKPVPGYDIKTALLNGLIASLVTIGGYEKVVNFLRGLKKKPNK